MTVPINDSRRCSTASNVWLRSSKRFRNVSSAKRSAITSLILTNSFNSIPSDFPCSNGNPAMNHVSICLSLSMIFPRNCMPIFFLIRPSTAPVGPHLLMSPNLKDQRSCFRYSYRRCTVSSCSILWIDGLVGAHKLQLLFWALL